MIIRAEFKIILGICISIFCLNGYGKFDPAQCNEKLKLSINDVSTRRFENVFIQEEHEGNLNQNAQPIGTPVNVFSYYRPLEIRENLIDQVKSHMDWNTSLKFKIKSLLSKDPWEALDVESKLKYLDLYEKNLLSEKGSGAVWNNHEFLLMKRKTSAPDYITEHLTFENTADKMGEDRFRNPEVMTKKENPALTVSEALARAAKITTEIGHGPPHFHVFTQIPLDQLRQQLPAIKHILQLVNDQMFAEKVSIGTRNLALKMLNPWSLERSTQIEQIVNQAAQTPKFYDEKFSFLGFRYWGLDATGKATISFEIRGGDFDPPPPSPNLYMRVEVAEPESRSKGFSYFRNYLNLFVLMADRLQSSSLPLINYPLRNLNPQVIERSLQDYLTNGGFQEAPSISIDRVLRQLSVFESNWVLPNGTLATGLLVPFSDLGTGESSLATYNLVQEIINLNGISRSRPLTRADSYKLKEAYRQWANEFRLKNAQRVSQLQNSLLTDPLKK